MHVVCSVNHMCVHVHVYGYVYMYVYVHVCLCLFLFCMRPIDVVLFLEKSPTKRLRFDKHPHSMRCLPNGSVDRKWPPDSRTQTDTCTNAEACTHNLAYTHTHTHTLALVDSEVDLHGHHTCAHALSAHDTYISFDISTHSS